MDDAVRTALSKDTLIDITTTGRKSGQPRRIEIAFILEGDGLYITATPDRRRNWFANMRADPRFTFHLKQSLQRDIPATATPITDVTERRAFFTSQLGERWTQFKDDLEDWIARSPLVRVRLEDGR
ncbi:MAG: DUF385 domain-containing protein [Dehalococcoidia bacterium]|nr:DUF385 domain-containing protein [Dehalococcoidia bacterium]